jgi:hypothetical protein
MPIHVFSTRPGLDITFRETVPGAPSGCPSGAAAAGDPQRRPSPAVAALTTYTGADVQDPTLLDRARTLDVPALLIWA